jgi:hypothetical protein
MRGGLGAESATFSRPLRGLASSGWAHFLLPTHSLSRGLRSATPTRQNRPRWGPRPPRLRGLGSFLLPTHSLAVG